MLGSIYKKTKHPHVSALLTRQPAGDFLFLLEEENKEKKTQKAAKGK